MQGPAHDIAVGDRAPDFALPALDGKFYQFYERTKGRPLVMLFYPGRASDAWTKIERFVSRHHDFANLGVDILAISFDRPDDIAKLDMPFFVWSDSKQAITTG